MLRSPIAPMNMGMANITKISVTWPSVIRAASAGRSPSANI